MSRGSRCQTTLSAAQSFSSLSLFSCSTNTNVLPVGPRRTVGAIPLLNHQGVEPAKTDALFHHASIFFSCNVGRGGGGGGAKVGPVGGASSLTLSFDTTWALRSPQLTHSFRGRYSRSVIHFLSDSVCVLLWTYRRLPGWHLTGCQMRVLIGRHVAPTPLFFSLPGSDPDSDLGSSNPGKLQRSAPREKNLWSSKADLELHYVKLKKKKYIYIWIERE